VAEGFFDKFSDGVRLARRQDKVIGGVVLQHHPHASYVVTGMAPVTLGIQVACRTKAGRVGGRDIYFFKRLKFMKRHDRLHQGIIGLRLGGREGGREGGHAPR
jgi:hypothetical protein